MKELLSAIMLAFVVMTGKAQTLVKGYEVE